MADSKTIPVELVDDLHALALTLDTVLDQIIPTVSMEVVERRDQIEVNG